MYYCTMLIAAASWQYLATTLLGSIWRIIQDNLVRAAVGKGRV